MFCSSLLGPKTSQYSLSAEGNTLSQFPQLLIFAFVHAILLLIIHIHNILKQLRIVFSFQFTSVLKN